MIPSRNFTHPFSFHFCLKDMVENRDKKASEQDTEMEKVKITPKLVELTGMVYKCELFYQIWQFRIPM